MLVKGVNKTIIEINDTGNEVFEKVVLYIRPQCSTLKKKELEREAQVILREYSFEDCDFDYYEGKSSDKRFLFILFGVMSVIAISLLMYLIF